MDWTQVLTPTLGSTGLLAAAVIMILTGRLLPKATVDARLADKDAQIDTWKTAYERAMTGQEVQRSQITELLEATRTTTHVIQALPRAARLDEGGGRAALVQED